MALATINTGYELASSALIANNSLTSIGYDVVFSNSEP